MHALSKWEGPGLCRVLAHLALQDAAQLALQTTSTISTAILAKQRTWMSLSSMDALSK